MDEGQEINPLLNPDDEIHLLLSGSISVKELDRLLSSEDPADAQQLKSIVTEAASNENNGLLITLLNKGYQLNVLNDENQTLMHLAYYSNSQDILNWNRGQEFSNWNNYNNYTDCNGLSHLHIACATGQLDVVKKFLDNGEDIHARLTADCDGDKNGFTPLHFAVAHHKIEVIKLLLEHGADINASDYSGSTPLHFACAVSWDFRKFCSKELLEQHSCWAAELDILKLLLECNCDVNLRDESGNTPLLRIFNNDYYYCPLATTEATDNNCITKDKLARSLQDRQFKKFCILMEHGTNITAKNCNDESILHCIIKDLTTARYNYLSVGKYMFDEAYAGVIKVLLKKNAGLDVNAKNKKGESPIILAVSLISHHIVKVLLDYNVDYSDINMNEDTFFRYPNIVLTEHVVNNLEKTISALVNKGFKLTLGHNLAIMKFLVHDVNNCDCEFTSHNDILPTRVGHILYYGSSAHTKRIFMKAYKSLNEMLKQRLLMCMQIFLEFCKQAQYPLIMDQEFLDLLYKQDYSEELNKIGYKNDVSLMKSAKLKNGMTMYNFLMKSPNIAHISMYFIHGDEEFCVKQEFEEAFPTLLIHSHFAKSMVRIYIESSALKNYMSLLLPSLPDLCYKMIIKFLNNEDILRLCEAALLE